MRISLRANYLYRSVMANGTVTDNLLRVTGCGPGCISIFNVTLNLDQGQARIQDSQYVLDQFVPNGAFCPVQIRHCDVLMDALGTRARGWFGDPGADAARAGPMFHSWSD